MDIEKQEQIRELAQKLTDMTSETIQGLYRLAEMVRLLEQLDAADQLKYAADEYARLWDSILKNHFGME